MSNLFTFVDRDGTLFGTCNANYSAYQEAFDSLQIRTPTNLFESIHNGLHITKILEASTLLLSENEMQQLRELKAKIFAHHLEKVTLNEQLLSRISQFKFKFIVTNSSFSSTQLLLNSFEILKGFDFKIVSPVEGTRPKPYPDLYLRALSLSQASNEIVTVFEDSDTGAKSAINAGLVVTKIKHVC